MQPTTEHEAAVRPEDEVRYERVKKKGIMFQPSFAAILITPHSP